MSLEAWGLVVPVVVEIGGVAPKCSRAEGTVGGAVLEVKAQSILTIGEGKLTVCGDLVRW